MFSVSDFLEVVDRLNATVDASAKDTVRRELEDKVRKEIRQLFDDPKYPNKRRSFGVIRKRLGIIDESSEEHNPAWLRRLLFDMGARVHRGEGDEALWELLENQADRQNHDAVATETSKGWILPVLLALAAVVTILTYFDLTPSMFGPAARPTCDPSTLTPEEFDECIVNDGVELPQ